MQEAREWFQQGEWTMNWDCKPHPSIDFNRLYENYFRHPERWAAAFEFLARTDLDSLEAGVYPIMGNEVYAMVSEYETKTAEEARYESHRKFADIQHLITGSEGMGLGMAESAVVSEPYSEKQDVMFYNSLNGQIHPADSKVFFIFFPSDAHQPCLSLTHKEKVKKIVIKVGLIDGL